MFSGHKLGTNLVGVLHVSAAMGINVLILNITHMSANSGLAENTVTSFFQSLRN